MTNKSLIHLLEQLDPDDELVVAINSIEKEKEIATTYDIGYEKNEYNQLVLKVSIETGVQIKVINPGVFLPDKYKDKKIAFLFAKNTAFVLASNKRTDTCEHVP